MSGRHRIIGIAIALGAVLLGGGYALAAHHGAAATAAPDGTITACVTNGSGRLRIVSNATECRRSESVLSWNNGAGGAAAPAPVGQITIDTIAGGDPAAPTFEIDDYSWGVENPTTIGSATGGAGAGKAKFNEFTITKKVDTASPALMFACASGKHIPTVVIEVRRKGGNQVFMKVTLTNVFISSIDQGSSHGGDTIPTEQVAFVYGKIEITETPVSGPAVTDGWDITRNARL